MFRLNAIRKPVAALTAVCGALVAVGGPVTSIHGAQPETRMAHTSFAQMLVYTFVGNTPFWQSVGFVVLLLGALMIVGALVGLRTLVVAAALLAVGAELMWAGLVAHTYSTPDLPNIHELNPANLPWADLRAGAWLALVGALLGLLSAFWLRRRQA